jgi:hypothetical protein
MFRYGNIVVRRTVSQSVVKYYQLSNVTVDGPLGGASEALAPGADFEGAPKRRSPTGHTLIRSCVVW